jgi:hypothetical protein
MTYRPVRTDKHSCHLSLLLYEDLLSVPFPALLRSWTVHLDRGAFTHRDYTRQTNPLILHRKELLLPLDDPQREEFLRLTEALEADGLFQDTRRIGYRRQWEVLLAEKGWSITGHVARKGDM